MSRLPSVDPDLTQPSARDTSVRAATGTLAVHWVFPVGRISALRDGQRIGRDASCEVVLSGNEVSRQHASVHASGPWMVVRDVSSRNGVFVGGERVSERRLGPGDCLRVGDWVGIVRELRGSDPQLTALHEIAPGWYGGPELACRLERLRQVATSDLPVVIQGETGTGKEGAARATHAWSARRGPFVAVDCGALPEHLAESLLFGHVKGAFSGADRASAGYFRTAHGGTLFLDEVLNLRPAMQAKLLRVLESREVVAVGEARSIPVDVRIVCAAQEPLAAAAARGEFRADLMARLEGATLVLPPLRERRQDIVPLFHKVLELNGGAGLRCQPKFVESLLLYDWPMNVRELVLLARRLVASRPGELLKRSLLPERMLVARAAPAPRPPAARVTRQSTCDEEALARLVEALRVQRGNLTQAAAQVGLSRGRAYRLLDAQSDVNPGLLRRR